MNSPGEFDLDGLDPVSLKAVQFVLRIAAGELDARAEVSGSGDGSDAVLIALNMMAETLQRERQAREQAERQLEARRQEAQLFHAQRMEALGRLAGVVAHDFNNLLQVITMCLGVIDRRLAGRQVELTELNTARQAADQAAALTRDLLAFARRDGADAPVIHLDERVADTQAMLARLLGADVALRVSLGAGAARVAIHPNHLGQVLINLTVNARDAMPDGGEILVQTRLVGPEVGPGSEPGEFVEVTVSDHGVGIPDELQERIFEPFFTTKPVGRGTGLGLSTTYRIVHQARGRLVVRSRVGHGTTVAILLPVISPQ